jgi:hypothetical protein
MASRTDAAARATVARALGRVYRSSRIVALGRGRRMTFKKTFDNFSTANARGSIASCSRFAAMSCTFFTCGTARARK